MNVQVRDAKQTLKLGISLTNTVSKHIKCEKSLVFVILMYAYIKGDTVERFEIIQG